MEFYISPRSPITDEEKAQAHFLRLLSKPFFERDNYELGWCFETGFGVKVNFHNAGRHYDDAFAHV